MEREKIKEIESDNESDNKKNQIYDDSESSESEEKDESGSDHQSQSVAQETRLESRKEETNFKRTLNWSAPTNPMKSMSFNWKGWYFSYQNEIHFLFYCS